MYQCYGSKYLYIEFGSGSRIFFNLDPDPNIEFYIVNFEKKFWRVKSFYKKIVDTNVINSLLDVFEPYDDHLPEFTFKT